MRSLIKLVSCLHLFPSARERGVVNMDTFLGPRKGI